jgi:hypothetical protein
MATTTCHCFPGAFRARAEKNDRFCRSRDGRIFRFNPEMGLKRERSRVNRCRCVSVASRAGVLRPTEGPKTLDLSSFRLKTSTFYVLSLIHSSSSLFLNMKTDCKVHGMHG